MAKVTLVKKAQKAQGGCRKCGVPIEAGQSYFWFSNLVGRTSTRKVFCAEHRPRRSDLTLNDKKARAYAAQEALEDIIGTVDNAEDLECALNDAANEAREVADEYRESISNMPESLQQSCTAEGMEENADALESWADTLEQAASEVTNVDVPEDCDDDLTANEQLEAVSLNEDYLGQIRDIAQEACDGLEL